MLYEALTWLVTPCPRDARGHLVKAIALEARWRRCRQAWREHIVACHAVIADAVAQTPASGRVTVLGSGILAEIPLDLLTDAFAEVLLVDRIHLPQVRWRARRHPRIRFITADLLTLRPDAAAGCPLSASLRADLVISANLLSQLPLLPLADLARRGVSAPLCRAFGQDILIRHLAALPTLAAVSCLITDTERQFCDGSRILAREDALLGIPLPPADWTWNWTLAPRPEASPQHDQVHRMAAIIHRRAGCVFPSTPPQHATIEQNINMLLEIGDFPFRRIPH